MYDKLSTNQVRLLRALSEGNREAAQMNGSVWVSDGVKHFSDHATVTLTSLIKRQLVKCDRGREYAYGSRYSITMDGRCALAEATQLGLEPSPATGLTADDLGTWFATKGGK